MDDQGLPTSDRPRTNWTLTMDNHFIDIMLEQVQKGNKVHNTFCKKAWEDMASSLNEKFGLRLNREILQNRSKKLKSQYSAVKSLLDQSGFRWDDARKMVTADDSIWDDYLKVHFEAKSYRTKSVPKYNDLWVIYGNETGDTRDEDLDDDVKVPDMPEMKILAVSNGPQSPAISPSRKGSCGVRSPQLVEGIDNHLLIGCYNLRTNWTPTMDRYFIEVMIEQVFKGYKDNNIFHKKAWKNMVESFNTKFGLRLDKEVLKSRFKKLRMKHNTMKILLDHGGFQWDESKQMMTANDSVWDDYVKAHPEARSFRTKTVPNYKDLCMIFGKETANKRSNCSGQNVNFADDMSGTKMDDGVSVGPQSPTMSAAVADPCASSEFVEGQETPSIGGAKTNWTPPMDRYFIDIMIEQIHRGYKNGISFQKEAWTHMIKLFNEKFGLQFGKESLRNRYRKLRMQYNAIKILLDHGRFHWDGTRKMVIADDFVWDHYLKEHPEARPYRVKTLPNYNDLCVIYANTTAYRRQSCSGHNVDLNNTPGPKTGVSGDRQSLTMSTADGDQLIDMQESSSHSGGSMDACNRQKKRLFSEPSSSQRSRKARRCSDEGMVEALREMAVAVKSLASKKQENDTAATLENVVHALQALPDIDEDLFLDACDLLEDEMKAKMFLSLDVSIRKKWLMRKLRP